MMITISKRTIFDASVLNTLLHWISSFLLKFFGWRKEGTK